MKRKVKKQLKKQKAKESTLERAIRIRMKHIKRLRQKKVNILAFAREDCRDINKVIAQKQVLLDALRKGLWKV